MLCKITPTPSKLYMGFAVLAGGLALAWLTLAASSTAPCTQQIWVGSNPLQVAQQSAEPVSDYTTIGLWDKARISAVQNLEPGLAFLGMLTQLIYSLWNFLRRNNPSQPGATAG